MEMTDFVKEIKTTIEIELKLIKKSDNKKKIETSEKIQFKQIEIEYLEKKDTTKLDYMNEIFEVENEKLEDFKGVYVFVLNKEFNLKDDFFKEVYLYKKTDENNKVTFEKVYCIASDYNDDKIPNKLKKNKVFYCGQSQEIFSRIYEHLTNGNYSGDKSLKLGFKSRASIKNKLTCYIHLENDETKRSQIEQAIHNQYGYYFGKK